MLRLCPGLRGSVETGDHFGQAKIACVGDSLTAGYPFDSGRGPDASVSGYPYHLQELLADEGYEVRNFGKGETTVVSGSKSYRSGWYNETWQVQSDVPMTIEDLIE